MSVENPLLLNLLLININEFLYYFRPIIFSIGIIGNCLDVLLFSRRKFRTVSCCIYFLAAAVTIVIQLSVAFGLYFYAFNHVNPITANVAVCKLTMYGQQFTAMVQRWLMTAASFDRYACSSTSANLRRFATVRVACHVVLTIVIIWLIIPIYRLVFYSTTENTCDVVRSSYTIVVINGIYTTVAGVVIPLVVMVPSLLLMYKNLRQKRQRCKNMILRKATRQPMIQEFERKRDQQVLAILIVQIIVYCILIMPLMIIQVYNATTAFISNKSADRIIIEKFMAILVSDVLATIYSAVPFYLNTMTSNTWLKNVNAVQPFSNHITPNTPVRRQQMIQNPVTNVMPSNGITVRSSIRTHLQHINMD